MTLSNEDPATDRKRKLIYWTGFAGALFALVAGYLLLVFAFDLARSSNAATGAILFLTLFIPLAQTFATALCRRFGLSLARKTHEALPAPRGGANFPTVLVGLAPAHKEYLVLGYALITLLLAYTMWTLPTTPGTEIYGYGAIGFFTLCTIGVWGWCVKARAAVMRADAKGVTCPRWRRKLLPWSQITSGEITTTYNALGCCQKRFLTFTSTAGKNTFVDLSQADYHQSEILIAHLRQRCTPRH